MEKQFILIEPSDEIIDFYNKLWKGDNEKNSIELFNQSKPYKLSRKEY